MASGETGRRRPARARPGPSSKRGPASSNRGKGGKSRRRGGGGASARSFLAGWRLAVLAGLSLILILLAGGWLLLGNGPERMSGQTARSAASSQQAGLTVAVLPPPAIGAILPARPRDPEGGAGPSPSDGPVEGDLPAGDGQDPIARLIEELDAAEQVAGRPAAAPPATVAGWMARPPRARGSEDRGSKDRGGEAAGDGARIAIVIDDLGTSEEAVARLMALPGPVTYSFLTVGPEAMLQADTVARAGYDVMLHLPMEPMGRADPGPNALLLANDTAENLRRFHWHLDRMPRAIGVNNHMGSRFTADETRMRPVLEAIQAAGLFWLDSRTSGRSVGLRVAEQLRLPAAQRDLFLDHDPDLASILAQLRRTEAHAAREGQAIAIGHPYPETLAALESWMPEAKARGFRLVGMSELIADADREQPAPERPAPAGTAEQVSN